MWQTPIRVLGYYREIMDQNLVLNLKSFDYHLSVYGRLHPIRLVGYYHKEIMDQ
jgi:hypothetical protein